MAVTEEFLIRQWQTLTISNNFIFGKTMELYPDLCRRLIEKILHVKIRRIEYLEREKIMEERLDCKGIRLDVYVADELNRVFNLEMQVTKDDGLSKRTRYYQSLLDLNDLKRGHKYTALRESYIVFICLFDYFGRGRQVYTFRECCEEDLSLRLNDGATKIFLNTEGILNDADDDIKNFLEYVAHGIVADEFIKELDSAVQEIKFARKVRLEYVTLELMMQEREEKGRAEGRAEGLVEGRAEGRIENMIETIKKMLSIKIPFDDIIKISGWSREQILRLKDEEFGGNKT